MLPPEEYAAGKAAGRIIGEASSSGSSPSALAMEDLRTVVNSGRIIVTESVLTMAAIEQLWPTVKIQEIAVLPIEPTGTLDAGSRQELMETLTRRVRTRKPGITDEALQQELRQAEERYDGVIAASNPFVVNPEGASSDAVYAQFEPLALHAVEVIDGRSPTAPPAPADVNEGLGQAGQPDATTTEVVDGAVESTGFGKRSP